MSGTSEQAMLICRASLAPAVNGPCKHQDLTLANTIDTITLPGLETEVAVTGIRVSRDVINHATVTLFYST